MSKILIVYLLLLSSALFAQTPSIDYHKVWVNDSPIDIQQISIGNADLKLFIENYIKDQTERNSLFRQNFGYLTVSEIISVQSSQEPLEITGKSGEIEDFMKAKVLSFAISIESHPFTDSTWEGDCWLCDYYPPFYTVINGRIVLIYDEVVQNVISSNGMIVYTKTSRDKFIKLVEPFLQKSLDPEFVFCELGAQKEYKISEEKRRTMTKHDIYKQATFIFDQYERFYLLRNGKVEKITTP